MKKENLSFQRIKQEADKGDANAQLLLGDMYVDGKFVEKNSEEALRYYELSAKQGNAKAKAEVQKLHERLETSEKARPLK